MGKIVVSVSPKGGALSGFFMGIVVHLLRIVFFFNPLRIVSFINCVFFYRFLAFFALHWVWREIHAQKETGLLSCPSPTFLTKPRPKYTPFPSPPTTPANNTTHHHTHTHRRKLITSKIQDQTNVLTTIIFFFSFSPKNYILSNRPLKRGCLPWMKVKMMSHKKFSGFFFFSFSLFFLFGDNYCCPYCFSPFLFLIFFFFFSFSDRDFEKHKNNSLLQMKGLILLKLPFPNHKKKRKKPWLR